MAETDGAVTPPKKRNPFEGVTHEKYARMLKAYMDLGAPSVSKIAELAQVGETMVKRALSEGWPKLGLPPLSEAAAVLLDPNEVHAQMNGMAEAKKTILTNLFGTLPGGGAGAEVPAPKAAADEAVARAAESGMAARVSLSIATKAARAVELLAERILDKMVEGEIEIPDTIRPEHIFLLAKAADTASAGVNKAIKTERLFNGQPEDVAGTQVVNLISGATPAELAQIASTGQIPLRLLGLPEPQKKDVIDVAAFPIELEDEK